MCIWIVGGRVPVTRMLAGDESVETGDESVEAGDESIQVGEKTQQSCYNNHHKNYWYYWKYNIIPWLQIIWSPNM